MENNWTMSQNDKIIDLYFKKLNEPKTPDNIAEFTAKKLIDIANDILNGLISPAEANYRISIIQGILSYLQTKGTLLKTL